MIWLSIAMAIFSLAGALDRILGGKLGIGKEFEKGLQLFGTLALSMIGMIIISPLIARLIAPVLGFMWESLGIDPSVLTSSVFANDMGGASLALEVAENKELGYFNGLVVSSMMGCTVSFTIPYALGIVEKEHHKMLLMGLLCGVITIPPGCFVSGLICSISPSILLINLLPLILLSAVIALGLLFFPGVCVKIFGILGAFIKIIITLGLALGILDTLTGLRPIKGLGALTEGAEICLGICVFMTGALPALKLLSIIFRRPLRAMGRAMRIDESSAMGFVSTLATSVTTFEMMNRMDKKGIMLNSAFAVSASFVFADHLAFTMTFESGYIGAVVAGKLISGALALILAVLLYGRMAKSTPTEKASITSL